MHSISIRSQGIRQQLFPPPTYKNYICVKILALVYFGFIKSYCKSSASSCTWYLGEGGGML